jgi:hypothetical protein
MSTTPPYVRALTAPIEQVEVIRNTWDQVGPYGWAISPLMAFWRRSKKRQVGWKLWQRQGQYAPVFCEVREVHFEGSWQQARKAALVDLMRQAEAITGIPAAGWARNPMDDYVSREVNKARPLRRTEP